MMFPSPLLVISLPGLVMTPAFLLLIWQWDQIGEREREETETEREREGLWRKERELDSRYMYM